MRARLAHRGPGSIPPAFLLLLLLSSVSFSGCSRRAAPNVVLVTIDTLRADHLGCYGNPDGNSPSIDEFSRRATLYTQAMATAPWTLPTHASIFTGRFPFEHGAHSVEVPPDAVVNEVPLAPSHVTLAEALRAEGYATAAIVANLVYLRPAMGLNQGFETYTVLRKRYPEAGRLGHVAWKVRGEDVNRFVSEWLEERGDGRFFLFVNYMDTHFPYEPPKRDLANAGPRLRAQHALFDQLEDSVLGGEDPAPDGALERYREFYADGVAAADEAFGELLGLLKDRNLYRETLVVLTSDHGEYLGEHRILGHSKDVYHPALWIPFVVKEPGQTEGRVVETLASAVDLPRLILDALPESVSLRQRRHFPYVLGEHPVISENYYSRLNELRNPLWGARFDRVRTAIFDETYKYIHSSDGRHELYDLALDPNEGENLIQEREEIAEGLAARLGELQAGRRLPESVPVEAPTPEEIEPLRALGYIE